MPQRIEVNVQTGKQTVLELTQAEIDYAISRTEADAEERAKPREKDRAEKLVELLVRKGVITTADADEVKPKRDKP